jgi:hypothetical protein
MNALISTDDEQQNSLNSSNDPCSLLVMHEDDASREHAELVVEDVVRALWSEVAFELVWCEVPQLDDPATAAQATEAAVGADIILISLHSDSTRCDSILSWANSWIASKRNSSSLLAALIGMGGDERRGFTPIHVRLRNLASRAQMDFLPLVIHSVADHGANSVERVVQRATETTPVLDSILRYQPPPPEYGWGINE